MKTRLKLISSVLTAMAFSGPLVAESLWIKGGERSLFADRIARQPGDLLVVIVEESTQMSASQNTASTKDATINNVVNRFLFSPATSGFGTSNGELPATDIAGSNDYAGGGSITNSQSYSTRFSVRVVDRLPNGNLVIEGIRLVAFSNERHYMVLTGLLRQDDIDSDNTVGSNRIADARIETISEGTLTSAQKKGWLMKLNDLVNPF